MRVLLAVSLILAASTVRAADPPEPAGCADYLTNKTGGDAACDAAIAVEKGGQTKSTMLFRRAYMEDAAGDFKTYPKALADLDAAIALWPQNSQALHERGYLYNEYGRWKDAEADLDAQIKLQPSLAEGYEERALSRFGLGDLAGVFEDRNSAAMLSPNNVPDRVARARALMWLGRFDEAAKTLDEAAALADQAGDKKRAALVEAARADFKRWTTIDAGADAKTACNGAKTEEAFTAPGLIGACTRAFLDGATPKDKADALTQRGPALEIAKQDRYAGLDDMRIAYALDPSDPSRAFNLGSWLENVGSCEESLPYLDKSLAAKALSAKESALALAARSAAKYCLGDLNGAFADGKRSFEIEPNEVALTVLGDTIYAKTKSYDEAKMYWIGAYHMGDRDDGLIARLKDAGVAIPPPDEAAPTPKDAPPR
jgi:tetratricopeptide (TPR) repeat protein